MKFKNLIYVLLLIIVLVAGIIGCTAARRPQAKPPIPEKISQGPGKEPRLSVYVVQDKKRVDMGLESYLENVVAGEMKNFWPMEALKAQAIVARTYVLHFIATKGGSKYAGADVSTDFQEAQAWNPASVNDRVKRAVSETRGQVIVYDNDFINSWFHSHSGGMTATAREGLNFKGPDPAYIRVVKSPDANAGPPENTSWTAVIDRDSFSAAASKISGKDIGSVTDVRIARRGPSGRATQISVNGVWVPAVDLRTALDPMKFRSTLITSLRVSDGNVIIKGKGFGHGVGMSQWGAKVMAERGQSAQDIIRHYFKGVNIADLW